ncbi:hypothetical protein D3C87_232650 [compost metagenome]
MNYLYTAGKFWKIILITPLLIVFCHVAYSQETVVIGNVMNDQHQRIPSAEIRLGKITIKSNSKGTFQVKTAEFPVQLSVKHSQYKSYLEVVRAPAHKGDTVFLDIVLGGKETQLEEVTVNASRVIWAYPKAHTHIIDYALVDNELLLVVREDQKYVLRRIDSIGNKIVDQRIKKSPVGLFEDCSGGIHLVYPDSIFELKLIRNSIGMLRGYTYEETMGVLGPCALASWDNFILKNMGPHNKSLDYFKVERDSKNYSLLYTTIDRKRMRELDEYATDNDIPVQLYDKNAYRLASYRRVNASDREKFQNQSFYQQVLSKPLYAPIFEINDSLYIYDHFKDSALVYTLSGDHIRSFQFSYHYFENWKNKLYVNEENTKLYAKYESEGLTVLRQINPSTGKVINVNFIEKHIYPMNIQIRNNSVYYLYKLYTDNSIHYLYKQSLKE